MKKLTTLLAVIMITMTATARDFFGVSFGDSYALSWVKIESLGFKTTTQDGDLIATGKIKFAGIEFEEMSFSFTPTMSKVSFMRINNDYKDVYNQTVDRLTNKYGEGLSYSNENGMLRRFHDGSTKIDCILVLPKRRNEPGAMLLVYEEETLDDSEL